MLPGRSRFKKLCVLGVGGQHLEFPCTRDTTEVLSKVQVEPNIITERAYMLTDIKKSTYSLSKNVRFNLNLTDD